MRAFQIPSALRSIIPCGRSTKTVYAGQGHPATVLRVSPLGAKLNAAPYMWLAGPERPVLGGAAKVVGLFENSSFFCSALTSLFLPRHQGSFPALGITPA